LAIQKAFTTVGAKVLMFDKELIKQKENIYVSSKVIRIKLDMLADNFLSL
tara:strand:+ start:1919 stop:2068 length:150 start_codon:yes stop_codon:yes gene_type:complete